jgi:hypothetical protein
MITFVATIVAMPAKIVETVTIAKEMAELIKRATGVEVAAGASFGGRVNEVALISQYDSLAHMEAASDKVLADADFLAGVKRFEGLLVPGASRDHIWRHV